MRGKPNRKTLWKEGDKATSNDADRRWNRKIRLCGIKKENERNSRVYKTPERREVVISADIGACRIPRRDIRQH